MKSIVFLGNYAPRCCGIATFTQDLRDSVMRTQPDLQAPVVMVSDHPGAYAYPPEVSVVLEEGSRPDYRRVAREINRSGAEVVSLQHEFGIYGGADGEWLIDLLGELRMPVVTTCHTVLKNPSEGQKRTLREIARLSSRMVVMAEKGREFLRDVFGVPDRKITTIAHGIPDLRVSDSERLNLRRDLGWEDRKVLLTFGLLSHNKGVEYAIRALPEIVREHPEALYVVVGATHPNLVREHGESYRDHLMELAAELGVADNLAFINRFVARDELVRLIAAADIYLTPYLNEAQITSGTLAFAFGLGKPVISTPYWHAQELLADNAGILIPFRDSGALASAVSHLFEHDADRLRMSAQAYRRGLAMSWSEVGKLYHQVLEEASRETVKKAPAILQPTRFQPELAPGFSFPPSLVQLERMTGEFGIFQHSKLLDPDEAHGFCTDDNARAAIFLTEAAGTAAPVNTPVLRHLLARSRACLWSAWNPSTRRFRNFMDVRGEWLEDCGSEDSHGRTLWALGTLLAKEPNRDVRNSSGHLFSEGCVEVRNFTSPRAWAFALLGLAKYRTVFPSDPAAWSLQKNLSSRLVDLFQRTAERGWRWMENSLTYDNAKIPQSLLVTYEQTGQPELRGIGLAALDFLIRSQTAPAGHFRPVGCEGFWQRGGEIAKYDQQPLEAQATIAACLQAEAVTGDPRWRHSAVGIYGWFLGKNDNGVPVSVHATGGCHDGLTRAGCNLNQGAESILAWLQSTSDMLRKPKRSLHGTPRPANLPTGQIPPAGSGMTPGHAAA